MALKKGKTKKMKRLTEEELKKLMDFGLSESQLDPLEILEVRGYLNRRSRKRVSTRRSRNSLIKLI